MHALIFFALLAISNPRINAATQEQPPPPARPEFQWDYKYTSGRFEIALIDRAATADLRDGCLSIFGHFTTADSPDCGDFEAGIMNGKFTLINLSFYSEKYRANYRYAKNYHCALTPARQLDCDADGLADGPTGLDGLWALGPGGTGAPQGRLQVKSADSQSASFVLERAHGSGDVRIYAPGKFAEGTHVVYATNDSPVAPGKKRWRDWQRQLQGKGVQGGVPRESGQYNFWGLPDPSRPREGEEERG